MHSTRIILLIIGLLASISLQAKGTQDALQITRERAAALAQERYPGKIVRVQTEKQQYRIRVLQADGRVITVLVDGQSGRVKKDGI